MAKGKGYELVPQPVPTRQRASIYKEIVTEFLASGEKSVLVAGTERKPITLLQGLRKAIEVDGRTDVKVVQRGHEVFLVKD
jgi:hypothetical protein